MVQTAQNPYEKERFNTQDDFIQQGQDLTSSLTGTSSPQATPLTSPGASATADVIPPPTELQTYPTEKYSVPQGGQISYTQYNPSSVQGVYAKYFNPLTSKLGESSASLGGAVGGFNTAAGTPRSWESVGGQDILKGVEENRKIIGLTGSREVQTSPGTPSTTSYSPPVISGAAGDKLGAILQPIIQSIGGQISTPATPPTYGTEQRNFYYPEYDVSPAKPLAEAAYAGPTNLNQDALDYILKNIGTFSSFMNPEGGPRDLTSGYGAQELQKLGEYGMTPGELRFNAKYMLQSPEYQSAASQTQRDLVKLYQDFLRTQGEAGAIAESRTSQEKAISDEAKKRIAALEAQAAAQKDLALYALGEYQTGRGDYGSDNVPYGYELDPNQPNPDQYKVYKKKVGS
jgi:hypothetical protein